MEFLQVLKQLRFAGLGQLAREVAEAERFIIVPDILDALKPMLADLFGDPAHGDAMRFPLQTRPPAEQCVITVYEGGLPLHLLCSDDRDANLVSLHAVTPLGLRRIGSYPPGGVAITPPVLNDLPSRAKARMLMQVATAFCAINEPRLTTMSPAYSRQVRRAAERDGFSLSARTSEVRWSVMSPRRERPGHSGASDEPSIPLHYRRGHYRKAQPHFHGAMQLPDAIDPAFREGWWQWIEGCWVGHPAFGVIRHDYTPAFGGIAGGAR